MSVDQSEVSLTETLCDLALLPLRLAVAPLVAAVPPEAREHLRAAYRETREAARSLAPPGLSRRRKAGKPEIIVE
ncbi:MAG: hypothetical protein KGJ86_12530 [Chloroflexota bacterium]|nr:hypothetical protein [Chloroflexota bacterium]